MKRSVFHIFLFFIVISSVRGQDIKVSAAFDSTRIYLGDQIKFTVTIEKPSGLKLRLPLLRDTLIKNIDILSGPVIDSTVNKDGRIKIIEKYLVTSFDSGHYTVPPVYAELKNEAGLKRFFSDYSRLEVIRVNVAPVDTTAKIYDIIKPYSAPVTFGEIIPWVLLFIVAGVAIWMIIRYVKNHKKITSEAQPLVSTDPAHVIAFRELEKLKREEIWQKGETKLYYTRLTEILRQYLENRYRVYSLELTTSETLDALVKTGFKKNELYNQLKTVLNGADLVKFAKYKPEPAENEAHFQSSWEFVDSTKEIEMAAVIENESKGEEGAK